ncbi:GNAT family N-acetyltransferase [Planococcus halocryophilus]|uniref:GNAT family N-acetyltransferase n=2 Tax=Planococcus halocryophilus TaxID=1215089 RepID=A0A1C7DVM4_9BACL|nr:GNAT family N-acetyltransferase [Planococcus halocryophilus]
MQAAITDQLELAKITPYKVADGYPSEEYKEIIPYKIKRYSEYHCENEWEGIIIHNESQTIMGDMGFRVRHEIEDELELGYSIAPDFQGFGFATEMAQAIVGWGLKQPGIIKIVANCDASNMASVRVLEKAGLKQVKENNNKIHWTT